MDLQSLRLYEFLKVPDGYFICFPTKEQYHENAIFNNRTNLFQAIKSDDTCKFFEGMNYNIEQYSNSLDQDLLQAKVDVENEKYNNLLYD